MPRVAGANDADLTGQDGGVGELAIFRCNFVFRVLRIDQPPDEIIVGPQTLDGGESCRKG